MSKAFLREDDLHEEDPAPRPVAVLPKGAKNYLTPEGHARLQQELTVLGDERTGLAASSSEPEVKRRLSALDQRIQYLQFSLRSAEVISPLDGPADVVRFGATVIVREKNGEQSEYRLVGADETDPARGRISWLSPLAQALLNARAGERVRFQAPRHERELEILKIAYE